MGALSLKKIALADNGNPEEMWSWSENRDFFFYYLPQWQFLSMESKYVQYNRTSMETKSQRFLTFNDDTDLKYCNNVCQYMPQINNDPLSMFIKQRHVLDTVSY